MRRIAVIGDCHGCIDELELLIKKLQHESIDEIWHLGDLVDRGPDSGAVVRKCMEEDINGVLGNHESTLIKIYKNVVSGKTITSDDKAKTCSQLRQGDIDFLAALPLLHVFDDLKVVLVHAGLEPRLPPWKTTLPLHHFFASQTHAACHLQLVHPDHPGKTRWWGWDPKNSCSEKDNNKEGWVRWHSLYDEPYTAVYGHSVYFNEPYIANNTVGIDTGCVYGGNLTALILPEMKFIQVPALRVYVERKNTKTPYATDPW